MKRRWDRDSFLYWWPVTARVLGVMGGFSQGIAVLAGGKADPGFLGFCGALIIAPFVFDAQERRNERRRDDENPPE